MSKRTFITTCICLLFNAILDQEIKFTFVYYNPVSKALFFNFISLCEFSYNCAINIPILGNHTFVCLVREIIASPIVTLFRIPASRRYCSSTIGVQPFVFPHPSPLQQAKCFPYQTGIAECILETNLKKLTCTNPVISSGGNSLFTATQTRWCVGCPNHLNHGEHSP
jgi:hypothetical protein